MKPKMILMDIEGTMVPLSFVYQKLFPYAEEVLKQCICDPDADPEIKKAIEAERDADREGNIPKGASLEEVAARLLNWQREDSKLKPLKIVQEHIWRHKFKEEGFFTDVYGEVKAQLDIWKEADIRLAIYSSATKGTQQILFDNTQHGSLLDYFEDRFYDLENAGSKKSPQSYRKIAEDQNLKPEEICFLSDMTDELDAAKKAGFQTRHIVRESHRQAKSYDKISLGS